MIAGAHRPEDLAPGTRAYLSSLPASMTVGLAGGQTALLCHGLGDNDMNGITADDYGYALEANDELQALLSPGGPGLVVKGHRHRHAVWRIGRMTLVDAGSLLEPSAPCAAVVDAPGADDHAAAPVLDPASWQIRPARSERAHAAAQPVQSHGGANPIRSLMRAMVSRDTARACSAPAASTAFRCAGSARSSR